MEPFGREGDGYSVVEEHDSDAGVYVFRMNLLREPPLIQWSLVIGDCLHNIRSALDHLFWALVLLKHPTGSPQGATHAMFPIYRDVNTFKGKKYQIEEWVGQDITAMLERMQPFASKLDPHPLLFIHENNIEDKHKLLIPVLGAVRSAQTLIKTKPGSSPPEFKVTQGPNALVNGAELGRLIVKSPESVVDVYYSPSVRVCLERKAVMFEVVPTLGKLIKDVEKTTDFLADSLATQPRLPS